MDGVSVWYLDLAAPAFGLTPMHIEPGWTRDQLPDMFVRIGRLISGSLKDLFPGQVFQSSTDIIDRAAIGTMALAWYEHDQYHTAAAAGGLRLQRQLQGACGCCRRPTVRTSAGTVADRRRRTRGRSQRAASATSCAGCRRWRTTLLRDAGAGPHEPVAGREPRVAAAEQARSDGVHRPRRAAVRRPPRTPVVGQRVGGAQATS